MPGTRKLGRTSEHRNAMLRAMVTYLFENGKIETTVTRAKEVRSMAEKMVTLGKKEELHAKRQVYSYITKETVAKKVIDEYGPKYADRNGGYTRIVKIGNRGGSLFEGGANGALLGNISKFVPHCGRTAWAGRRKCRKMRGVLFLW